MNGTTLTLGLAGGLVALSLVPRRGSRNESHRVFHFSRSLSPRDLGEGTHWGTQRAARDRWSHMGRPAGTLVEAQIRVKTPYVTEEVGQWLSPAYALTVLVGLEEARQLVERAGLPWDDTGKPEDDNWLHSADEFDGRCSQGTLPFSKREAWAPLWKGLSAKGYDGIVYPNNTEDVGSDSWITFTSEQVKVIAVTAVNPAWRRPSKFDRYDPDEPDAGSLNVVTPAGFDRTAMSRSEPSAPVRHLQTHAPALLRGRILDFGSGQGVDAKALGATAYDPHHPSARVRTLPKGPFDTVLGLYVLNVLPPTERTAALRLAASAVKPGGSLVLAVRPSADVASTAQGWTRHKDGHQVMGTDGTRDRFQRGFSPAQLRQYATRTLGDAFSPVDVPALSGSVLLVLRRVR